MKHLLPVLAIAVLAAGPIAASAADSVPATAAPADALAVPGAHFTLIDADGRAVGEVVSESASHLRLRVIGYTGAAPRPRPVAPDVNPLADRTFHPDYSRALTPFQMQAAWQAELDRLNPPAVTGGG